MTIQLGDIVRKLGYPDGAIYRVIGFTDIAGIPSARIVRVRRKDLKSATSAHKAQDSESLSFLVQYKPK